MSVLGEASAEMRWAGTLPRMACSRAASVATFGCARCCGERSVLPYLELGTGIVLRTCCVRGDFGQVGVAGKHISAYSWRAGGWWGDWRVAARPFGVCHGLRQPLRCSTGRAGYLRVYQLERHRRKRKRQSWYHGWSVDARRWDGRKKSQFLGEPAKVRSWQSDH